MARSILIIDDEQSILQTLEGILIDEGFEVHCELSAVTALKKIDEMMPDLVILDIWMPDMNGIDALMRLKQDYPYIQVIMMSGHADVETAVKATRLGAYDFIEKPLSMEELLLAINNALNFYQLGATRSRLLILLDNDPTCCITSSFILRHALPVMVLCEARRTM